MCFWEIATYPSPNLTLTLTSRFGQNVRFGVGGQFLRIIHWSEFTNVHPHRLQACNFLSQHYMYLYNIFIQKKVLQVFFSNSCKVRGGKNRKWRWMFAFDRCEGKIWLKVQKYRTSCWITHALPSNEWPKTSDPRPSENQAKASERSNMCGFDKEKIYFLILYMCVLYHDRDVWWASDEKIRLACHALHVLYMSIRIKTCRSIWGNNYEII